MMLLLVCLMVTEIEAAEAWLEERPVKKIEDNGDWALHWAIW